MSNPPTGYGRGTTRVNGILYPKGRAVEHTRPISSGSLAVASGPERVVDPVLYQERVKSLQSFIELGPNYWLAANYFTLIGLDAEGNATGDGTDICPNCVRQVAREALMAMEGYPTSGGAMRQVAGNAMYELVGSTESYEMAYGSPARCAECKDMIF